MVTTSLLLLYPFSAKCSRPSFIETVKTVQSIEIDVMVGRSTARQPRTLVGIDRGLWD